jgi:hypothetical protein
MRCDQCNKFAAYDDSTEPEVDVDLSDDGSYSGQVRIVLTHDECGQELKEASFDFEGSVPDEIIKEHKSDGHVLNMEADSGELTSRSEGKGRYMKTFYGYDVALDLTCSCQERSDDSLWQGSHADDIQASHMDELV